MESSHSGTTCHDFTRPTINEATPLGYEDDKFDQNSRWIGSTWLLHFPTSWGSGNATTGYHDDYHTLGAAVEDQIVIYPDSHGNIVIWAEFRVRDQLFSFGNATDYRYYYTMDVSISSNGGVSFTPYYNIGPAYSGIFTIPVDTGYCDHFELIPINWPVYQMRVMLVDFDLQWQVYRYNSSSSQYEWRDVTGVGSVEDFEVFNPPAWASGISDLIEEIINELDGDQ